MSVIVHRCDCGHSDLQHSDRGGQCSLYHCHCRVQRGNVSGAPEVIPTFATLGSPIERVVAPGEQFGTRLGGILKTCDCTACREMYAAAVTA